MYNMPCRRRAAGYKATSDFHLLEVFHRGLVFSDFDNKLCQGLFCYPQVIF